MQLTADSREALKAVDLIAALSGGVFLILLFIVVLYNSKGAINSMVRDNILELAVGIVIGAMVSLIFLVLGKFDKSRG